MNEWYEEYMYRKIVKPTLARVLALFCFIIFLPVMIVVAAVVMIDSRGSFLFIQERMGKGGRIFKIYKFRTMINNAIQFGTGACTYENDWRITRVGRFIRKTSIDELPQLVNIMLGQMCFIGPRPLLPDIPLRYDEYPEEYKERFAVLPGMFCLVDTLYRAEASLDMQCKLDVEYVHAISFLLDVKIIYKTFKMVLMQEGVYVTPEQEVIEEREEYDSINPSA